MRRRFAYVASVQSAAIAPADRRVGASSLQADLKLFALTYAAGFVAISMFLA